MTFQKGNQSWKMRRREEWVTIFCLNCGKEFKVHPYRKDKAKFCSQKCAMTYIGRTHAKEQSDRMLYLHSLGKAAGFKKGHATSQATRDKIKEKRAKQIITKNAIEKCKLSVKLYYDTHGRKTERTGVCLLCGGKITFGYYYCREHYMSEQIRKKLSDSNRGKTRNYSEEKREQKRLSFTGKNNPKWKGGITPECNKRVGRRVWRKIRQQVWKRDNYTCQTCGKNNILLVAHHKIPYRISKDDSPSNLISLCSKCHTIEEWGLESYANRV